jgi:two-component system nitrogen regulation sensor histidine kinase NtrY
MENSKKKGPRIIGAIIVLLIILFFIIEFFVQKSQEFSPKLITNFLLFSLYFIVFLLFLILLFVLSRNLIKLYLERKRKVVGAHFRTKLVLFFIALSFIPTLLLFFFASDLINRNIEQWFKTPIDKILSDTKSASDGFYVQSEELTLHYAQQLGKAIQTRKLIYPEKRGDLMNLTQEKLTEYKLDEISIYIEEEEIFAYLNASLPRQYYQDVKANIIKRAHLGEVFRSIEAMGKGELIRTGISFNIPDVGNVLVITGKFLHQNYAQKLNNISAYVQRYRQLKIQKNPVKTLYIFTLVFITLIIIFAASWIGFHLAKGITVPIEKLAQATKEVSRGNLKVKVEDPASDELGILIDSFNQMVTDLREGQKNIAQKTSELEARKQYIETILENIITGVVTLDSKGIINTMNPSAREMLALSEKNLIGKSYKDVLSHEKYREILKNIQLGLKNRYELSEKEVNINLDGQNTTILLTLSPLRQPNNKFSGMIMVLDNLTQLINAQKIAAWKEVAQRVAHEIKNPLTPIQLSAERIIKNLRKKDQNSHVVIKEGAKTILEEASTIKSLADEFSNFARMPSVKFESADIHQIIDQTISPFKGIFPEIEFDVLLSADVPSPLQIDPEQMKRVYINLIDNAIDAMKKKGEIRIQTSFDKNQQRVKIEISDSGPGISIRDKEKLFLPDFSTKKKGTGLGLAIVNRIIKEHNGSITVENNQPHGAKFIIQIPS